MMGFDLSEEQRQLKETARRFTAEEIVPVAAQYDEGQTFPAGVVKKAWELGLMNFEIPTEYGGPGLGVLDTCLVLEELNYGCAGITNAIAANGLAAIPVIEAGTPAQRAIPRPADDRAELRGLLHYRARGRLRRRRYHDDVSARRRRIRAERDETLHFERHGRQLVRGLRDA